MDQQRVSRRRFLAVAGAAAAAAPALAGCGSDDQPTQTSSTSSATEPAGSQPPSTAATSAASAPSGAASSSTGGSSVLPAFMPKEVAPPDLPATDSGVPAVYYKYPASPAKANDRVPGSGGTVTAFNWLAAAPPPGVDKNPYWKELNKRLGVKLDITFTASRDYKAKVATTVAGGDLPDLMPLSVSDVSHVDDLLKAKFQDLSPWLSGDAIAKFPNLAALPTTAWKNMVFNGGIYAIPYSVPVGRPIPMVRQDILDQLGIPTPHPSDGAEFVKLCTAVTDAKAQRWAFGNFNAPLQMARMMAGVPNQWAVEGGKFTSMYQTDEYKKSIEIVRDLWKSDVFFPDAPTATYAQNRSMFIGGKAVFNWAGYVAWPVYVREALTDNPKFEIQGVILPKWDGGGQAAYHEESGAGNRFTALKKASDKRIEELLRVIDWIATPFGSEEYLFTNYGIAGRDYTLDGTDPVATDTGTREVQTMSVTNFGRPYIPIYVAGQPEMAKAEHETMDALLKVSEPLPTVGLRSETELTKGAALAKPISQMEIDIVLGRKQLSDWDGAVKTWLDNGGKKIAEEYQESYATSPLK